VVDDLTPHVILVTEVEALLFGVLVLPAEDYLPGRVQPDLDQGVLVETAIGIGVIIFLIMLEQSCLEVLYPVMRIRLPFAIVGRVRTHDRCGKHDDSQRR